MAIYIVYNSFIIHIWKNDVHLRFNVIPNVWRRDEFQSKSLHSSIATPVTLNISQMHANSISIDTTHANSYHNFCESTSLTKKRKKKAVRSSIHFDSGTAVHWEQNTIHSEDWHVTGICIACQSFYTIDWFRGGRRRRRYRPLTPVPPYNQQRTDTRNPILSSFTFYFWQALRGPSNLI